MIKFNNKYEEKDYDKRNKTILNRIKIDELENPSTYYHGIRFDAINRLESIFQTGYILPGNKVKSTFKSYDGKDKFIYMSSNYSDNCNMGKYISVMQYEDDLEFEVFIKENLFFAIKDTIKTIKTKHISYDDYCNIKEEDRLNNYYSYAFDEYFVDNKISLDDIIYIGIDSKYYNGNYNKTVEDVNNLIEYYKIDIPFKDVRTNTIINKQENKKLIKNK